MALSITQAKDNSPASYIDPIVEIEEVEYSCIYKDIVYPFNLATGILIDDCGHAIISGEHLTVLNKFVKDKIKSLKKLEEPWLYGVVAITMPDRKEVKESVSRIKLIAKLEKLFDFIEKTYGNEGGVYFLGD